ncbi:PIR Superfamily Protein [Plasmodium malariae]|uniref:PIR Superfamily Protein n=1 Tax=Plasmodium malariae TaxID=5858 RepID=A0A1A8WQ99_PLAMA|nr:PIR Superfamily Protein [Plasmodium malariae]
MYSSDNELCKYMSKRLDQEKQFYASGILCKENKDLLEKYIELLWNKLNNVQTETAEDRKQKIWCQISLFHLMLNMYQGGYTVVAGIRKMSIQHILFLYRCV